MSNNPVAVHLANIARRQRVLWIGNNREQTRHTMDSISGLRIEGSVVRYTNGMERVTFPEGGSIKFITPRTLARMRGATFDHIFMDSHEYLDSPDIRLELALFFDGSLETERYTVIG